MIRTPRQILRWWYEMDGTQEGKAKYIYIHRLLREKLNRRDNWEDLGVDGRTNNETALKK
jgi:hypothetical protein